MSIRRIKCPHCGAADGLTKVKPVGVVDAYGRQLWELKCEICLKDFKASLLIKKKPHVRY